MRYCLNLRVCLMLGASLITAAWASGADAQEAPSQPNAANADIIVTARRREESQQTVPVSISVISSDVLAKQGLTTTNDLQRLVPGVILNGAGSMTNSTYTIRGQGKAVAGPGLPSVITYFNEVPLPSIGSYVPTFDIDNVQVLKGPQGTLFGRNTTGGAVLVYSKTPTMDLEGYIQGDLGNYEKRSVQGALNLPIVPDVLSFRFSGYIDRSDGYTRDLSHPGRNLDDTHTNAFRLSLLFEPTDSIRNVLVYDYLRSDTNSLGFYPAFLLNPALQPLKDALLAVGKRVTNSEIAPYDRDTLKGLTNTTTIDAGPITFKNIFGYRYIGVNNYQNATGLRDAPLPDLGSPFLNGIGFVPGEPGTLITTNNISTSRQYTDEVQVSGTLFNDAVSWLVGGFWLDLAPDGQNFLTLDIFRPTSPSQTLIDNVNTFLGGIWPVGSQANTFYGDESKALFGNISIDVGKFAPSLDGITLNAGYRYTWDKESVCSASSASTLLADGTSAVTPFASLSECEAFTGSALSPTPSYVASGKFKAPTYTLGIDYEINNDIFVYFTTRRGYRAGGLNSPTLAPILAAYQTFGPQKVTDYEVGVHTKWRTGTWSGRFNLAAFTGTFTDLQLQAAGITAGSLPGVTADNAPSNLTLTINAGKARARGIEADATISPISGLNFSLAGSYLNQKYLEQTAPAVLDPFFQASTGFTGVPKWSYQAAVDYDLPLDSSIGTITLHADHYYLDDQYQGPVLIPSYRLTNVAINWEELFGRPVDLTFYLDNAFNNLHVQNIILSTPSFGVYAGNYAPPRRYGARLRFRF